MSIKHLLHLLVIRIKTLGDFIQVMRYKKTYFSDDLKKLENINSGKRCFIIGNGPSLTIEDLNLLKDEDCFACNRIYGLYENTEWRPKYYGIQDPKVLEAIMDSNDLPKGIDESELVFLSYQMRDKFKDYLFNEKIRLFFKRYISIYSPDGTHREGFIPFSDNLPAGIYDGMSIIYTFIQIAAFMGYKEIYLIGADHNYSMKNGVVDQNRSYAKGIKPIDMTKQLLPELEILEISFRKAKDYAEKKGIKIKNATRGGKLEVFERIDFDLIFKND